MTPGIEEKIHQITDEEAEKIDEGKKLENIAEEMMSGDKANPEQPKSEPEDAEKKEK